jgi:hypothetical protein
MKHFLQNTMDEQKSPAAGSLQPDTHRARRQRDHARGVDFAEHTRDSRTSREIS